MYSDYWEMEEALEEASDELKELGVGPSPTPISSEDESLGFREGIIPCAHEECVSRDLTVFGKLYFQPSSKKFFIEPKEFIVRYDGFDERFLVTEGSQIVSVFEILSELREARKNPEKQNQIAQRLDTLCVMR